MPVSSSWLYAVLVIFSTKCHIGEPMTIAIGKIVKSNTHIDYVCQVYNPGEIEPCPKPADYSFGTFVAIHLGDDAAVKTGSSWA